jgi:DNA-binding XRE family transcriptional regulator
MPAPVARSQIGLRLAGWEKACKKAGLITDGQRAAYLGVTRQTINLVQNGHKGVGERLIIAALSNFEGARFEDLFVLPKVAA